MAFHEKLNISREKLEYAYSIFLIIAIPAALIVFTVVLISGVRTNIDDNLRRKADLANEFVGGFVASGADNKSIQDSIDYISEKEPQIVGLFVSEPVATGSTIKFKVIAGTDQSVVNSMVEAQLLSVATSNRQPVASLVEVGGQRVWSVATPIIQDNEVIAVSNLDLSLSRSDQLISQLVDRTLLFLMGLVVVIIVLLLNHFKFVEYAKLFKKLKEVDQLKSDFLSVATHELKAPMAVIKGALENVIDGVVGHVDEPAKESLKLAFAETDRLANLVADLLNVSRIEQGKISYNKESNKIEDVPLRVVKQYIPRAEEKGLKLHYQPPQEDIYINVDVGRWLEIMTNLVDNAVKYSKQGTIEVFHKVEDKTVKTVVRDTGIGMSAQERENLFNRFYRVRNEETKNIGGTGLGLWIIKQYIEAMDGNIYVDSLQGVGTEFTVEFPVIANKPSTQV